MFYNTYIYTHIHTDTHTHTHIYMCVCVCVCVCIKEETKLDVSENTFSNPDINTAKVGKTFGAKIDRCFVGWLLVKLLKFKSRNTFKGLFTQLNFLLLFCCSRDVLSGTFFGLL